MTKRFVLPALAATWAVLFLLAGAASLAQSPNNPSIDVPFEFHRNEIVVQVKINGKGPFNMMLDTGTDPSAIDLATAKEIGLKIKAAGHQGSGGGTDVNLAYETRLPLVEVGGIRATNIDAAAIDLSKISERGGKVIHGILGQSFLNKRIVQFDYPKSIVRFYEKSPYPKGPPNTPKLTTVSFHYNDNVLIDDVWVNGKKMTASIDTGSNSTFQLAPDTITALGLEADAEKGEAASSVGYNGEFKNRKGQIKNVTIGAISIDNAPVTFFGRGTGHDKTRWGINIGNVFFKDFVVTIDYQRKTITFERP